MAATPGPWDTLEGAGLGLVAPVGGWGSPTCPCPPALLCAHGNEFLIMYSNHNEQARLKKRIAAHLEKKLKLLFITACYSYQNDKKKLQFLHKDSAVVFFF